jgi:hypothetical protein
MEEEAEGTFTLSSKVSSKKAYIAALLGTNLSNTRRANSYVEHRLCSIVLTHLERKRERASEGGWQQASGSDPQYTALTAATGRLFGCAELYYCWRRKEEEGARRRRRRRRRKWERGREWAMSRKRAEKEEEEENWWTTYGGGGEEAAVYTIKGS